MYTLYTLGMNACSVTTAGRSMHASHLPPPNGAGRTPHVAGTVPHPPRPQQPRQPGPHAHPPTHPFPIAVRAPSPAPRPPSLPPSPPVPPSLTHRRLDPALELLAALLRLLQLLLGLVEVALAEVVVAAAKVPPLLGHPGVVGLELHDVRRTLLRALALLLDAAGARACEVGGSLGAARERGRGGELGWCSFRAGACFGW